MGIFCEKSAVEGIQQRSRWAFGLQESRGVVSVGLLENGRIEKPRVYDGHVRLSPMRKGVVSGAQQRFFGACGLRASHGGVVGELS